MTQGIHDVHGSRKSASAHAKQRRNPPLLSPSDHARGGHERTAQAQGGARAVHRRRRTRLAACTLPGCGRCWHAGPGRLRRGGLHQSPASGDPLHQRRWPSRSCSLATEKLAALNPYINLRPFETRLTSENALEIFRDFDIIADGTDNFATRYLVNDACVLSGKPNIYASIFRFEGQATVFATKDGPCYRCLYPEPPRPDWCLPAPKAACSAFCRDCWG